MAQPGHFFKNMIFKLPHPPFHDSAYLDSAMFGAHQGHVLSIPKVFAEIQAVSKQRGSHHTLSSWLVAELTHFCQQPLSDVSQEVLTLPVSKLQMHGLNISFGKWETSICFGTADELPVFAYLPP